MAFQKIKQINWMEMSGLLVGVVSTVAIMIFSLVLYHFLFAVHAPKRGFVRRIFADALHDFHGGEHAVVHVVVLMHAIAPHEEHIINRIEVTADLIKFAVSTEVGRVSLLDMEHHGVADRFRPCHVNLVEFRNRKLDEVIIRHAPHFVAFGGKVFKANPHLFGVCNKVRAPVVEYLDTAELHVGFLHVNPVIGNELEFAFGRARFGRILDFKFIQKEARPKNAVSTESNKLKA